MFRSSLRLWFLDCVPLHHLGVRIVSLLRRLPVPGVWVVIICFIIFVKLYMVYPRSCCFSLIASASSFMPMIKESSPSGSFFQRLMARPPPVALWSCWRVRFSVAILRRPVPWRVCFHPSLVRKYPSSASWFSRTISAFVSHSIHGS